MDLATIIGMLGAIILVAIAISLGASPIIFVNPIGLIIVVGGSSMIVLSQMSFAEVRLAAKAVVRAFKSTLPDMMSTIDEMLEVSKMARKSGLLALENHEASSTFLARGLQMLADGYSPDMLKEVLDKERLMTLDRNRAGARAFSLLTDVSPAMGMVGTLIGLVDMLANMDDPSKIGPAMAVALLTTLYGVLIAQIIANPIAEKLELRTQQQERLQALWTDALMAIQQGRNPRVVEQVLLTYLPQEQREKRQEDLAAQEAGQAPGTA
ncbi:MotA/TolQ/ExbB proton channel family protein [Halochromatium salexigens]|uniref:Flagellar motor protein PomA n=1 Tax=Halochromatium salexigens TaxID=49447 RepID=A0AAJ0UI36_HALSE|nr:MotA/TolQ/ExbB proton channel family protein [Halochromatium salexigens]MBK5931917.1 flagellar motor protein PomA [Halochromatium salexigens]